MKTVPLGDIVTIKGGGTPDRENASYWGGAIPWASVKDFRSTEIATTVETITGAGLANSASNLIPAGAIIVPTRMAVGKAAINTVDIAINQDLKALFPIPAVDRRFLLHQLLAASHDLERRATGATVKGITLDVLRELPVSLPPIEEQRRIAATLDQADALRAKRRAALAQLDEMARAIFVEMFGDPISNLYSWPRVKLEDALSHIEGGWSPVCQDRPSLGDEWAVLKLGAVTRCVFDPTQNKALLPTVTPRPELEVHSGDLLFTRKNTQDLVAACALVRSTPPRLMIPDLIFRLRLADGAPFSPCFLHALLSFPSQRRAVQALASGSAGSMPNISKGRLLQLSVIAPPLGAQQTFSDRVSVIEDLKLGMAEEARALEKLFTSLQHRAFRGEL